ncbi:uncharacterized protein LOC107414408 [Ziziphus jujuba]|uniref:Uncharacterized protein LOC107414408 n=1 Tax=Ziziphus jujuba TaxID=326968 RepID=A0A6P6G0V3_ZIZJJ|nr:uncharacterized protein LOC107414408 [Ziziphus jujuba]
MGCRINPSNPPFLFKPSAEKLRPRLKTITFSSSPSSSSQNQQRPPSSFATPDTQTQLPKSEIYSVDFKTLKACKLGISQYPDFEYNAEGGRGTGSGKKVTENSLTDEIISVSFDLNTVYIPPLKSATTKFLGLPLPPFLKIDIVPELFQGSINKESGKVGLEFKAKFWFSVGSIYKAPPLLVETMLTSEESNGTMRSAKGERLDENGNCRLVGVATVDPIDDFLMNSFLGLPTECLADLNAIISLSACS